jgi:hypothetical protein
MTTATKTKARSTTLEDAVDAVDSYIDAVAARIVAQTLPGVTGIDVSDLDEPLRATCDAFKPGSANNGIDRVHKILATHCAQIAMISSRGVGIGQTQSRMGVLQLADCHAAFNDSFITFDRQTALDIAESDLADARRDLADHVAQLEAAVEGGSFEAVMNLRPLVEVELPGRLGVAEGRVLDLRAERAKLSGVVPALRQTRVQARADRIAVDLAEAEAALAAATAAQAAVLPAQYAAADAARAAAITRSQAEAAARAHHDNHAQAQKQRLRQLAGLPPLQEAAEPSKASTPSEKLPSLISRSPYSVTDVANVQPVNQRIGILPASPIREVSQ